MFPISSLAVLAQARDDNAAAAGFLAMFGMIFCGALIIGLAIQAVICWYLSNILKAIPEEHRKQQPNMVWLLMIPLVNIVWNFFVYPKISESFKSYFNAVGRTDVGDCGRGLSLTYAILVCTCVVPYLNSCTGLAALVVWIIVLVKFGTLKGYIKTGGFPVSGPTQNPPTVPPSA